ncbi:MAG TPA: outer membrane protein assembly factor BamD [Tepidisphaeraceae bacterium]|nr:outer membrane protein assembly factor BamD [Tepidisphaeraceae bacterium]
MSTPTFVALLLVLLVTRAAVAQQQQHQQSEPTTRRTWDLAGGQWRENQAPTTQRAPDAVLDRVEQLIDRRAYKAAWNLALDWVLANKTSPNRDRGLYLIAQSLYGHGDRIKAFYYCDELLDTYPESDLFPAALELQYRIADEYLDGYKRRWFGVPMFYAKEEAVEMLYRIRNRAPGSPLAERALLRTADHYRFEGQFDFAADAYAFYAQQYPRSPMTPRARLWGAYCSLAQFRGVQFDPTPVIDAREQLRSIAAAYPALAKEEGIEAILKRIDDVFAKKLYTTATYYRRTKDPRAAAYTYKYLIKAYPTAPETERARMWMNELPQWAQNLPGPTVVGEEGEATVQQPLIR